MKLMTKKAFVCVTAACVTAGSLLGTAVTAQAAEYNDFDYITSHVSTYIPQKLMITTPSGNIKTSATAYYITGSSSPDYELYLNGTAVTERGKFGTFGVYVGLNAGENYFEFTQQDGAVKSITITQGSGYGSGSAGSTSVVSSMYPSSHSAELPGTDITLQCIGPASASIVATVNGQSFQMRQVAAAQTGVPAKFVATYTVPSYGQTTSLGQVTYTMTYNGGTKNYTSAGQLYAGGDPLLVRVIEPAVSVFAQGNTGSDFITTAKLGATDYVVGSNENMYQLAMGGWIQKDCVTPLTSGSANNQVSEVTYSASGGGETFHFAGTTQPIATTWRSGDVLKITLHHTTGISGVPTGESRLFTGATVSEENGDTVITFQRNPDYYLWGYVVEYKDNVTSIYAKYQPGLSGDSARPLSGIHVVLDGGHGGPDPGALGVLNNQGATESDITADTAVAVKKRLESLGASVTLVGSGTTTSKSSYMDRMLPAITEKADFFLSLHCNSIGVNQNGLKPSGTEIYYYEGIGKNFAQTLVSNISARTGRKSRGAIYSNYRVTLNTCAPSVLVEMGFMSNPAEYDDMASRNGMFNTANAIGDSLVAYLA